MGEKGRFRIGLSGDVPLTFVRSLEVDLPFHVVVFLGIVGFAYLLVPEHLGLGCH